MECLSAALKQGPQEMVSLRCIAWIILDDRGKCICHAAVIKLKRMQLCNLQYGFGDLMHFVQLRRCSQMHASLARSGPVNNFTLELSLK